MKTKLIFVLFLSGLMTDAMAQSMNLDQVLQQVIDHYPSVKTAAYQVERAQQENKKIESQLGWQLNSQAGISRDVSAFGTPVDIINLSASMTKTLKQGATLSVDALINKSDSSNVFSAFQPNPLTSTGVNLNYRHPLAKGSDNPAYNQGLETADAGTQQAFAERNAIYDQLASQLIDLYLAAAVTRVKIKNLEQSIVRSKRLNKYINDRLDLGVAEEKDILQAEAQLHTQQAERQGLLMVWQKQKISLNRLMGKDWNAEFNPRINNSLKLFDEKENLLFAQIKQYSPALLKVNAQLQLAESAIKTRRDAKKDKLDLLMFVGNKTSAGNNIVGSVSESELVGGLSIEFNRGLDQQGFDAELYQAQIDRGIALQNKKQVLQDLQYNLSSLLAEIKAGQGALKAYRQSARSEKKKLNEAEIRHKKGRADTDQLIQFESQLSLAELSVNLQQIELMRRFYNLNLLRGKLWQTIRIPEVIIKFNQGTIK